MSDGNETIIISNNLHNPNIKILLLSLSNNNKIGQAMLFIEEKEAVLKNIFIEEKYRKQQYGSLLISKIFEVCHKNNVENLILLADKTNVSVSQFYEKLGFSYVLSRKVFFYNYEINIPRVIIEKKEFIAKWKNIKVQENFVNFDLSKLNPINNEEKIGLDSKLLVSILDDLLTLEEEKLNSKKSKEYFIEWFNQQRSEIIKNPKQWLNNLTTNQKQLLREETKKWWNNLTVEQRKIKLLEKEAQQRENLRLEPTTSSRSLTGDKVQSNLQDGIGSLVSNISSVSLLAQIDNKLKDEISSSDFDQNIKIKLECMHSTK